MSFRKKIEQKLRRKQKLYEIERLMKEKRSEEYEVLEEVFDRATLMTVYDFLNQGTIDEIYGVVKAGKESRVYWGKDINKKELAIKIFLTISSEFRRGMLKYIEGDPRFARVRRDTSSLVYTWAQKEFKNLQSAYKVGVMVPKPVAVKKNVLVMEFIGKNGVPAPLLKETPLKNPDRVYRRILTYVKRMYQKAGLVHADLSEYNVMIWKRVPIIFDLSQAVSVKHPLAHRFLQRDLENLYRFFKELCINLFSVKEMYRRVTGGKA